MTIVDQPSPMFGSFTLSSVCATLGRLQVLTGVFRDLLTKSFSHADWIENPQLKQLLWRSNTSTRILVEAHYRWTPEQAKQRCAVIIKRNAYAAEYKGLGGSMGQGGTVDEYGDPHYEIFWVGSHTLFCIGGTGAEAEILATEVQRQLTQFAPVIQRSLGLMRLRAAQLNEISRLEEAPENFLVPVTFSVAYAERWTIKQQAPRLRGISLTKLCE